MSTAGARLLGPGDLLLDASFTRVSPRSAARAGVRGLIRYTAGAATAPADPSHGDVAGKLITEREFAAILAAGLDIVANDEWYSTRVQEGAAAAHEDAHAAAEHWHRCGLAPGATIYPSWDTAPVPELWPEVDDYLTAYAAELDAHPAGYKLGAYAGTPYLAHALDVGTIGVGWRADAPSWSDDKIPWQPNTRLRFRRRRMAKRWAELTPAALVQTGNTWFGGAADENLVIRAPVGSHLEAVAGRRHPKPPPPPPPPPPPFFKQTAAALVSPNGEFGLTVDNHGRVQMIDRTTGARV